jgi:hypothetical protein
MVALVTMATMFPSYFGEPLSSRRYFSLTEIETNMGILFHSATHSSTKQESGTQVLKEFPLSGIHSHQYQGPAKYFYDNIHIVLLHIRLRW